MKENYNEELEKEIEEMRYPFIEFEIGRKQLLEKLNNRYQETNYPGYLYKIGLLYESNILRPKYAKEHYDYFRLAAEQNYLPALKKLIKISFNNINVEMFMTNLWVMCDEHDLNLLNDAEGKYLLAKYKMIQSIMSDHDELDFIDNIKLMKESSNQENGKAIKFMRNWELTLEEINDGKDI